MSAYAIIIIMNVVCLAAIGYNTCKLNRVAKRLESLGDKSDD